MFKVTCCSGIESNSSLVLFDLDELPKIKYKKLWQKLAKTS
jgi:hypothetical protein